MPCHSKCSAPQTWSHQGADKKSNCTARWHLPISSLCHSAWQNPSWRTQQLELQSAACQNYNRSACESQMDQVTAINQCRKKIIAYECTGVHLVSSFFDTVQVSSMRTSPRVYQKVYHPWMSTESRCLTNIDTKNWYWLLGTMHSHALRSNTEHTSHIFQPLIGWWPVCLKWLQID